MYIFDIGGSRRRFVAFIKIVGWWCFSFGLHIDLRGPYVAIHFPGGFLQIGWIYEDLTENPKWEDGLFGWD